MPKEFRMEKDALGEIRIDADCYWGIHTQRAIENFNLTQYKIDPVFIKALATVKKAACLANSELGFLDTVKAKAIITACDEIIGGKLNDCFPLDALQGGAGTSTNMNLNEVIANRALEITGFKKGSYDKINPLEDVNLHQSTNDVYPTALKIASIWILRSLSQNIAQLQGVLQEKEKEFSDIVKIGRTELQEAVPITLGFEFASFAEAISRDRWRVFKSEERLRVVNLGGTAVGTGLGAAQSYIFLVIEKIRELTGIGLSRGENLMDATANTDTFVEVSGILKANASNLIKIANDLRLMHLLGEINLPAVQAGSSIMPGKVNPVITEAVIQSGIKIIANDLIISEATSRSSLEINEFLPLLAFSIIESLNLLKNTVFTLKNHIQEIKANSQACRAYVDKSPTTITAFLPEIGYEKAGELVKEFTASGRQDLRVFLNEKFGGELVDKILSPHNLTALGFKNKRKE